MSNNDLHSNANTEPVTPEQIKFLGLTTDELLSIAIALQQLKVHITAGWLVRTEYRLLKEVNKEIDRRTKGQYHGRF